MLQQEVTSELLIMLYFCWLYV